MPVMYAISSDNARRASHTGPERPELPILFHLADVSRPRSAASDHLAARLSAEQADKRVTPADPQAFLAAPPEPPPLERSPLTAPLFFAASDKSPEPVPIEAKLPEKPIAATEKIKVEE